MNREPPLFSVVVPLYNKKDTILRTLDSINGQTFRDFEIIVVDDGSSDSGMDIVASYVCGNPLKLIHQDNSGVSAARNRGASESDGKYIAFLDADDEWAPEYLSELVRILARYPDANVVGTDYEYVQSDFIIAGLDYDIIEEIDFFAEWPWRTPINSSSTAIRKDFFLENGGYDTKFRFYEDAEFLFRLALKSRFYVSRKVLVRYNTDAAERATGGGVSVRCYPHWSFVDNMIKEGRVPSNLLVCVKNDIGRVVLNYAVRLNITAIRGLAQCFPNVFKSFWSNRFLSSTFGLIVIYPYVLAECLWCRHKVRSQFKKIVRKVKA